MNFVAVITYSDENAHLSIIVSLSKCILLFKIVHNIFCTFCYKIFFQFINKKTFLFIQNINFKFLKMMKDIEFLFIKINSSTKENLFMYVICLCMEFFYVQKGNYKNKEFSSR